MAGGKENNQVVKVFGEKPVFDFEPKNHVDLCTGLGLIDYERGVKMGGNGFWLYTGIGARLEWALLNYFITEHLKRRLHLHAATAHSHLRMRPHRRPVPQV